MRKIVHIFVITLLLSGTAPAQAVTANQVPPAVKKGFQARFPAVKHAEWKIKSGRNYEAEFTLKGTDIAVKFDSTGKWLETESAILWFTVPSAVKDTIAKWFKEYKVIETQTVQRWDEQRVIWEIHLEGANEIVKAQLNGDGVIMSRTAKPRLGKMK